MLMKTGDMGSSNIRMHSDPRVFMFPSIYRCCMHGMSEDSIGLLNISSPLFFSRTQLHSLILRIIRILSNALLYSHRRSKSTTRLASRSHVMTRSESVVKCMCASPPASVSRPVSPFSDLPALSTLFILFGKTPTTSSIMSEHLGSQSSRNRVLCLSRRCPCYTSNQTFPLMDSLRFIGVHVMSLHLRKLTIFCS